MYNGRCCHVADGIATVDLSVGRCYCHVGDGIATEGWSVGRCYCHVADGIATGSVYFNLSSEVLNRTSSHM